MPLFFRQKFLKIVLFLAALFAVERFCHKETDGFTLLNIQSHLPYHEEWAISPTLLPEKKELEGIFQMPFKYLCKGGQAYVFTSQDNKYVLKFFKHQHRRLPWIVEALPLSGPLKSLREKKVQAKAQALAEEFASYKLSFEELKKESGLILVHLNKDQDLNLQATIVDKLGISHTLDLREYEFILQKRAEDPLEVIKGLSFDEAKAAIQDLVGLFDKMAKLGICNGDPNLSKNFGFIGKEPVQIDIGRCCRGTLNKQEILRKNGEFKDRLLEYNPELGTYLEEQLKNL